MDEQQGGERPVSLERAKSGTELDGEGASVEQGRYRAVAKLKCLMDRSNER